MLNFLVDILKSATIRATSEKLLDDNKVDFYFDIPKNEKFGDYSSNIPLIISKWYKNNPPIDIATNIKEELTKNNCKFVDHIEIAKPGFINFYLSNDYWIESLKEINKSDLNSLKNIGENKKVQIEFVSANPTGPLHVGHGRCAVFGDALANLLKVTGYDVEKEYYINDAGNQIRLLGESVFARYNQLLGKESSFPENGYQGEYINDIAKDILKKSLDISEINKNSIIEKMSLLASQIILEQIKKDLENTGVFFDSWFYEKSLYETNKVTETIDYLKQNNFIFEKDNAIWMRTSLFGDQKDRVLIKSTSEMTYYASDIAYHQNKFNRGFEQLINIWGADHHGYIDRIKAGIKALNHKDESLKILLVQLVKLFKAGKQINMSTRSGTFITLDEVLSEVGRDATRFYFLLRRHDSQLEFDLDLAKEKSKENLVYYVQYAHARICSILKEAKKANISYEEEISKEDLMRLSMPMERAIIKKLSHYPIMICQASKSLEPHRITFYLIELAKLFHSYYKDHRIISCDKNLTIARISLLLTIKKIIYDGLYTLGISAPDYM